MEINKDNFEMILFDLLEGNFSQKEENEIYAQIDADPFLKEEWEMLQKTILPIDEVVFSDKESLLKSRENKKIIFPLFRVAAAIILLAIFSIFIWKFNTSNVNSNINEIVNVPVEPIDTSEDLIEEKVAIENTQLDSTTLVSPRKKSSPNYSVEYVNVKEEDPLDNKEDSNKRIIEPMPILRDIDLEQPLIVDVDQGQKNKKDTTIIYVKIPDNNSIKDSTVLLANNLDSKIDNRSKLREKANNILSYLKPPKIKLFKKKGTRKSFKLELEHDKYSLVTSIN